ncbi:MAG TPA: glycosyltransferase [Burkholderiales bacterium]
MRFAVVTPDPAQWVHVRAFDEVADAIQAGLIELGHSCERSAGRLLDHRTHILFGAHLLPPAASLNPGTILFNLEQIVPGALWVTQDYVERLRRHRVWDYSARNVAALAQMGIRDATHVPLGHANVLERIPSAKEDIDLLFYGVYNERRMAPLRRLAERGLKVHCVNGVYGSERDGLIARSRIVVNIHYYEQSRLEVARCFYLLANGRFVLSEASPDTGETGLAGGIAFASYEGIEKVCAWYLEHPEERAAIAGAGRELVRKRPQSALLAPGVAALGSP